MASPGLVQIYVEGKGHGLRERACVREWERRMGRKEVKKKAEQRGKRKEGGEGRRNRRKGRGEGEGGEREGMGIVQVTGLLHPLTPAPVARFRVPVSDSTGD